MFIYNSDRIECITININLQNINRLNMNVNSVKCSVIGGDKGAVTR